MEIKGIIKRTARDGKAVQLDNEQWYSHFSAATLFKEGDSVKITYNDKQKGDQVYHNWTLIEPLDVTPVAEKPGVPVETKVSKTNGCSMYTAYAKDIFVALIQNSKFNSEESMTKAIQLVKQAKEAFE